MTYANDETDGFGIQVRVAGDTNGDGRPELLIGSWSMWMGLFDVPTGVP